MTKLDVVNTIGDALTEIDAILSSPDLSPSTPAWHQLFALRKHLDDQQREIVAEAFQDDTQDFNDIANQLKTAADSLSQLADDITRINDIIGFVSSIASLADQVLNLV